jgi:DNA-binding MarR family transcriptional regulator
VGYDGADPDRPYLSFLARCLTGIPVDRYCSHMNEIQVTETPASLSGSVMLALLEAAHALEARLEAALARVGLSSAKYSVLAKLARAGEPLALSELAAQVSCVRSNMTQLVDRLEAEGLVRRVDDPEDRRMVRAVLTKLGEERETAGAEQVERIQSQVAALLTKGDRAVLERALAALK